MSEHDTEPKTLPNPAPPSPPPPQAPKPPPPRSAPTSNRGWAGPLALLLALLALAAVAFGGWRLWQLEQGDHAGSTAQAHLGQRVDAVDAAQAATRASEEKLQQHVQQQLSAAEQANSALNGQMSGLAERTRHLEDAVAKLSTSSLSAHDTTALDETDMLLRMAAERYALFHDGSGALQAYDLAAQTLATVDDPAFSGVRQSIDAERAALAATHPTARTADLNALAQLRAQLPALPPRPLDTAADATPHGFWQRTWQVLSHVVSVSRDSGAPVHLADARLARELAALDVAQAQTALLAWDHVAMHAALTRVDAALRKDFDTHAPAVQQARSELGRLQTREDGAAPDLGGALKELRNVRQVRDTGAQTAPADSAPAPASSSASTSPAGVTAAAGGAMR